MMTKKTNPGVAHLPYEYYFFSIVIIAVIGLADSIYLSISHYRVYTDMGYQSFCAISRAINCDTVSQNPYSLLIDVPVPVWGIFGYAFILSLIGLAWIDRNGKQRLWAIIFMVSLSYSIYSVILALISTFIIHSYCIMCILSYAVNLALLYVAWVIRDRFHQESFFDSLAKDFRFLFNQKRAVLPAVLGFSLVGAAMILFFPPYWDLQPPGYNNDVSTGITEDGHPWVGAESPELTITEFSDYRCFQCKKMHFFLRRLIENAPDKIRLIHRHFPMDHTINPIVKQPFHQGSAKLAIVALFSMRKGKFWEMNDLIFNISRKVEKIEVKDLAERSGIPLEDFSGIFQEDDLWKMLGEDIREGLRHGLQGTPGFLINGKAYVGQIPPEIIKKYIR